MERTMKLSTILDIGDVNEYKLHAARCSSSGTQPLDDFVINRNYWLDWNKWKNHKDEFNRKFIFSLMDFYHESDVWLFGGIFEVIHRGEELKAYSYDIKEVEKYSDLVGRLKIHLPKPSRGRAFRLEKHFNEMSVSEILKTPYYGDRFPGYENISLDFPKLQLIMRNEQHDWKAALESVKGIYCIFDRSNGKKYVGSAYGEHGIWSRWKSYCNSGHGGNQGLKELLNNNDESYSEKNFHISLLELIPFGKDDDFVINREIHWKKVLLSKSDEFGYNLN